MIEINDTLISEEIIEKDFVCNLDACKGACCVEGDAGAPVEQEEVAILEHIYPKVAPFFRGIDDEWETPLIGGGECAYVVRDQKGIVLCGIEQAYREGVIDWKKPISCHLYPIRLKQYSSFVAVNYDRWSICKDACVLGRKLQVPIYQFVKEALIRKFGEEWYEQLEAAAKIINI